MLDDEPARGLRQGADAADPRGLIGAEPAHRLPRAAQAYWRLSTAVGAVPFLTGALVAGGIAGSGEVTAVLCGIVLVLTLAAVLVVPPLRWRRWRYEIRDEEIDLRHGTFVLRRTVVPIRRVQHVDTQAGPLQGIFDLAKVSFHTAAGSTEIPALGDVEAELVRRRVAELARTRDDV